MPEKGPQKRLSDGLKNELENIFKISLDVVRKACYSLGHHPNKMELDDLSQQVIMLLTKNDCSALRSFKHESSQQTWLYTIARRHVAEYLLEQKKFVSLEDLPADSIIARPVQEESLLLEERMKRLLVIICKLTTRERELFHLWYQGNKPAEIAKKMGIRRESVYKMKNILVKKLRKFMEEDEKRAKTEKRL